MSLPELHFYPTRSMARIAMQVLPWSWQVQWNDFRAEHPDGRVRYFGYGETMNEAGRYSGRNFSALTCHPEVPSDVQNFLQTRIRTDKEARND